GRIGYDLCHRQFLLESGATTSIQLIVPTRKRQVTNDSKGPLSGHLDTRAVWALRYSPVPRSHAAIPTRFRVELHFRSCRGARVRRVRLLAAVDHGTFASARTTANNSNHLHPRGLRQYPPACDQLAACALAGTWLARRGLPDRHTARRVRTCPRSRGS